MYVYIVPPIKSHIIYSSKVGHATDAEGIPEGWQGLDCGPKSIELFREVVSRASTVIWNG